MNLTVHKRGRKKVPLPTTPVGGELPTASESAAIKADTEKKIETFIAENPQRPEDTTPPLNKPLSVKTDAFSLSNEYIEIAKRYVGIMPERTPTMSEFAKAVIKTIDEKNSLIRKLSQPRNDGFSRALWSSENGSEWN